MQYCISGGILICTKTFPLEISLQGSEVVNGMTMPAHRQSIAGMVPTASQSMQRIDSSPPKDIASPLSDSNSLSQCGQKFSDSSLSPNSPSDVYDEVSRKVSSESCSS